ncbi:MAG: hypothetical protein K8E24_007280 [Methanobacterium paludis]|nr:hypothetical protein [Methanobacterium paludis]
MNSQANTIILKEVKEVISRKDYLFTLILNIAVFVGVGYIFVSRSYDPFVRNLFMELTFIMFPPFAMWIVSFPLIQEKFNDEKIIRKFESLLTAPISLKTVWTSKMAAIFLLSYPIVLIIIMLYLIIWNLGGLNPLLMMSPSVWIMALIIIPMIPMAYAAFSSWSVLRFTHPKIMEILNFFAIGLSVLIFLASGNAVNSITTGHLVSWPIVVYSTLILIAAFSVVFLLIKKLNKERITI